MEVTTRRRRVYQDLALQIADRINSGRLTAGTHLPSERALAQSFGVSRASVREALVSLQASGLIAARHNARAEVTKLSSPAFLNQLSGAAQQLLAQPNGMADFQEARALFECGLARFAARHASQKEIDRLSLALVKNKRALGDPDLFAKTDVAFHDVLAEATHNPILTALNSALSEWLITQRHVVIRAPLRGIMRRAYLGHEAIYAAVSSHDPEQADRAMAEHLTEIANAYWKSEAAK